MSALKRNGDFEGRPHRPALYVLLNKHGAEICMNAEPAKLIETANMLWPDQEQDPDRTGKGWDIAVVGADR